MSNVGKCLPAPESQRHAQFEEGYDPLHRPFDDNERSFKDYLDIKP